MDESLFELLKLNPKLFYVYIYIYDIYLYMIYDIYIYIYMIYSSYICIYVLNPKLFVESDSTSTLGFKF